MTPDSSEGSVEASRRASWRTVLAVTGLATPVVGFFLPFLGVWASGLAVLVMVKWAGPQVWTARSRRRGRVGWLGLAGLWSPAVLAFFGVEYLLRRWLTGEESAESVGTTAWLFFPLCGPEDHLTPAVVALVVYVLATTASAVVRRPWPWVVGGLGASLGYDLTLYVASIETIC